MNSENCSMRTSIVNYCESIGTDSMLVQGAGGNVSWKDNDILWVKASGTWLADAAKKDIFVPVDLPHLNIAIESGDFSVLPRLRSDSELRPSIETLLHALMPHQVVVHLHAIEILSHLVRDDYQTSFQSLIDDSIHWTMVDYFKPGAGLASAISDALSQTPTADVIFLKSHGVVIGGDNVNEVNDLLMQLLSDLRINPVSNKISPVVPEPLILNEYVPIGISKLHKLALPPLYNRLKTDWALFPDHVVFLGPKAYCYDSIELLKKDIKIGNVSQLIFLKGKGVFTKPEFSMAKQVQLQCYYDILIRQLESTSLRRLREQQICELLSWDAELYRQNIGK